VLKVANRFSGLIEERQAVVDLTGELESSTRCELTRQYRQRPRTQLNKPILAGTGTSRLELDYVD
jgi:hypothetical protein